MYHIGYYNHAWWIQYNDQWMGTVSEGFWGTFAKANVAQWGGEIQFAAGHYCTPMGDDVYGTLQGSASITSMFFEKPNAGLYTATAHLNAPTYPSYWTSNRKSGGATFSSFNYGGPFGGPNGC
jgi:hypothetical protein